MFYGSSQFLNIHLDASISGNTNHRRIGIRKLGTNCSRKTKTHRAQATRSTPMSGFRKFKKLSSPHLMLTYIRRDNRFTFGQFVKHIERILRLNLFFHRLLISNGCLRFPFTNSGPPMLNLFLKDFHFFIIFGELDHLGQYLFHISHNGHIRYNILTNVRSIYIQVNFFRIHRKF